MGPYLETTESAAPPLLVLSPASSLVRITLCGVNSTCDGLTAFSRERPGEPVAGNPLGGVCAGGRAKAPLPQGRPLPTRVVCPSSASRSKTSAEGFARALLCSSH